MNALTGFPITEALRKFTAEPMLVDLLEAQTSEIESMRLKRRIDAVLSSNAKLSTPVRWLKNWMQTAVRTEEFYRKNRPWMAHLNREINARDVLKRIEEFEGGE